MLLVVFVPMLLDPEPRPARSGGPTLAIPPKDNPPPLPAPRADVATVVPSATVVPPPPAVPAQAGTQSPAAPKPTDAPKLEGFAVQVGAFRDEAKLAQSREKLAAAGLVHYTERLESKGGPLTRLRAGPYPTREAAEAALAKIKRLALDGKVVPLAAEPEERKR